MRKIILFGYLVCFLLSGAVYAVSENLEIPGFLNVKGVTSLESALTVTGDIKSTGGTIEAAYLIGNGSLLTNIEALSPDVEIETTGTITAAVVEVNEMRVVGGDIVLGEAGMTILLINQSGRTLASGEVLVVDKNNIKSCNITSSAKDNARIGVIVKDCLAGEKAFVCVAGMVRVLCDTRVIGIGDKLATSGTAGRAFAGGNPGSIVAVALESKAAGAEGRVWASVFLE